MLNAAALEFSKRGFHEASISAITRRAGVALGSFYTYFDSKDAVFRALATDLSAQVRDHVGPAVRAAGEGIAAERIIDEAEFVDAESFRSHYASTAERIGQQWGRATGRMSMPGRSWP